MGRAKPAWHGLGKVFGEGDVLLASEAVKQVAGDVVVNARPLYYHGPDGAEVQAGKYQAIVRSPLPDDPNEKVFGVTTERWNGVNYGEIACALDELSKSYKVETAGLIQDGSLCFISLRGPDFSVSGDEMQDYFIANLSNQPGNSHKILAAPVRVVCFNTNAAANNQSSINLSIPHSKEAGMRIKLAASLVVQFKEMTKNIRQTFEQFAAIPIGPKGVLDIAKATFPRPPVPSELQLFNRALNSQEQGALQDAMGPQFNRIVKAQESFEVSCNRAQKLQETVVERAEAFNPTNLRGTLWAAYNAATEVSDWREGKGADVSSVWGGRAREKAAAFAEALSFAKLN